MNESMSDECLLRRRVTFSLVFLIFARVVIHCPASKDTGFHIILKSFICSWNLLLRILFCSAGTSYAGYDDDEIFASEHGGFSDDQTTPIVQESSTYTNYQTYMNKTPRSRWSKQDTELFYEVNLAVVSHCYYQHFHSKTILFWSFLWCFRS